MAERSDKSGPSPLLPVLEKFIRDEWIVLERKQLTPWAFFNSGDKMTVQDFYGRQIGYSGVKFEGSPRLVFWSRYIEPFLEDLAFRSIDLALRLSAEKKIDVRAPLLETQGLLNSYVRKAYERMADIDRRLRGGGFPQSVPPRDTTNEQETMRQFIEARISGELRAVQPSPAPRWKAVNLWFKEHPLFGFLVGTAIAILGLLSKFLGAW